MSKTRSVKVEVSDDDWVVYTALCRLADTSIQRDLGDYVRGQVVRWFEHKAGVKKSVLDRFEK